jgi:hypothetical protein
MLKNINFKLLLPHFLIIAAFFVSISIYFFPLFQGKSMKQHDIVQFQGMVKEISDNRNQFNQEPLWTNAMFSGMPSNMISMDHYGNLIKPIHTFIVEKLKYPASLIFVGMVGFYLLLIFLNVNQYVAIMGAVGFGFATFNFISLEAGHNAKVACMMYMPYVLAGLVYTYRKNIILGTIIFAFGLAFQIVNNHIQITYYLAFICLAYVYIELYDALKAKVLIKFVKASATLVVGALLALGSHAGYFMSISEYSQYSIRGKSVLKPLAESKEIVREDGLDRDYVFNYSNSIAEPITFLIPDFYGGASAINPENFKNTIKVMRSQGYDPQQILSSLPSYFGEQPFVAGPIYMGAIICFLFTLGMLIVKDRLKWALFACTIVGILLSYGKNFPLLNYFLFDYFPMYNKFRSVTMAVVIPQFCMTLLGVLAIQELINQKNKTYLLKNLLIAAGIVGGIALLVFLFSSYGNYITDQEMQAKLPDWLSEAISEDRKAIRSNDAIRSFLFIVLAGVAIYLYITHKVKEWVLISSITFLTFIDLWSVDKRYLNNQSFDKKVIENYYTPTDADSYLKSDTDPNFRVLNLENPFNDARTSYFHKSIGGYSPAKLRRYQDLIERVLTPEISLLIEKLKNRETDFNNLNALNMLNTKYFLAGSDANSIIPNQSALGNAWFVNEIRKVDNPNEEIQLLQQVNTNQTAIIDQSLFKVAQSNFMLDTTAKIKLTSFKPFELKYESNNSNSGFAVFSEIYYPKGWTAKIDDQEAEIKQVNFVLRGLEIPKGIHHITFEFKNDTYQKGNMIGIFSSFLLYLGLGVGLWLNLTKKM